jgi:hypothetical protein
MGLWDKGFLDRIMFGPIKPFCKLEDLSYVAMCVSLDLDTILPTLLQLLIISIIISYFKKYVYRTNLKYFFLHIKDIHSFKLIKYIEQYKFKIAKNRKDESAKTHTLHVNVKVINLICSRSTLILQPETNKHRTKTGTKNTPHKDGKTNTPH